MKLLLFIFASMVIAASARAQTRLYVGDRVRLTAPAPDRPIAGRIVRADDQRVTIVTREPSGDRPATVRTIEWDSVTSVECSVRQVSRVGEGMLVGAFVGFGVGALIAQNVDPDEHNGYMSTRASIALGAPFVGMVLGGFVGAAMRKDIWRPMPPTTRVGLRVPGHGPVQFAVQASF